MSSSLPTVALCGLWQFVHASSTGACVCSTAGIRFISAWHPTQTSFIEVATLPGSLASSLAWHGVHDSAPYGA